MATKRLPMRQIREILRLKHDQQLSHRAIASAQRPRGSSRSRRSTRCALSCAPAKRYRRESRVALRALMPVQAVLKPLARLKNDGSGSETVQH